MKKKSNRILAMVIALLFSTTLLFTTAEATNFKVPIPSFNKGKVEKEPSFKGGQSALIDYMINNVKYPEEAQKEGISGTVYVSLIIEKDGSVSQVKVKKGVHKLLNEEAVRVVKEMPNWNPAQKDGKAVKAEIVLPISFKLSDKK